MPLYVIILIGVLSLTGPVLLGLGFWQLRVVNSFIAGSRPATATFAGQTLETTLTQFGVSSFYRQYRFTACDGKTYGCRSVIGGLRNKPLSPSLEVLYDPQNPAICRINSRIDLFGAPAIFLACGAGFMIAAPILWFVALLPTP